MSLAQRCPLNCYGTLHSAEPANVPFAVSATPRSVCAHPVSSRSVVPVHQETLIIEDFHIGRELKVTSVVRQRGSAGA